MPPPQCLAATSQRCFRSKRRLAGPLRAALSLPLASPRAAVRYVYLAPRYRKGRTKPGIFDARLPAPIWRVQLPTYPLTLSTGIAIRDV
jgi:hypothetical protein